MIKNIICVFQKMKYVLTVQKGVTNLIWIKSWIVSNYKTIYFQNVWPFSFNQKNQLRIEYI